MKMKKMVSLILGMIMIFMQVAPVYAEENETTEQYELVEEDFEIDIEPEQQISPYSLYLMNVLTSIVKLDSNKVGMRADVLCSAVMKK